MSSLDVLVSVLDSELARRAPAAAQTAQPPPLPTSVRASRRARLTARTMEPAAQKAAFVGSLSPVAASSAPHTAAQAPPLAGLLPLQGASATYPQPFSAPPLPTGGALQGEVGRKRKSFELSTLTSIPPLPNPLGSGTLGSTLGGSSALGGGNSTPSLFCGGGPPGSDAHNVLPFGLPFGLPGAFYGGSDSPMTDLPRLGSSILGLGAFDLPPVAGNGSGAAAAPSAGLQAGCLRSAGWPSPGGAGCTSKDSTLSTDASSVNTSLPAAHLLSALPGSLPASGGSGGLPSTRVLGGGAPRATPSTPASTLAASALRRGSGGAASLVRRASDSSSVDDSACTAKKPKLTGFAARHSGTSHYRGVSWHTQTGRWKAQIKVGGKDINLGRHAEEDAAARAYDRAAICARGLREAKLNFPGEQYLHEVTRLKTTPLDRLAAELRGVEERLSAQTSRYHGVRLNKRTNKWEAYIRVAGKHVHLGCHGNEVAAAQAFDQAAIVRHAHHLGAMGGKPQLVTNFPLMFYQGILRSMLGVQAPAAPAPAAPNGFEPLKDKYLQNLLEKCRQQGGTLAGSTQLPADFSGLVQ